jgi:DNA-binding MarR family transcriptional regulator
MITPMFQPGQRIGSISNFLQQLEKSQAFSKNLRFFRGHAKSSYKLEPSIYRNAGWIENESTMFKELVLRCPNDFSSHMTTFQCLVKMQHYGLPSRLLDVTSNPLVALYFTCEIDDGRSDAEVIVFDFSSDEVKYYDSDTVSVIANLAKRPKDFSIPEETEIDPFNKQESIKFLTHDIRQDLPHFAPTIDPNDLQKVFCVKPRLDNSRIIRQEGAFLLFGCNRQKIKPANLSPENISAKFVISKDAKKELREHLEKLGISKATLFPEIDQVAGHIKEFFAITSIKDAVLTSSQKKIADFLISESSLTIKEIAQQLGMSASAVSRSIAELLEKKIIQIDGSGRDKKFKRSDRLR